jgi:hypothetical protein
MTTPTGCPWCRRALARSETLLPGSIVLVCRECRQFRVEGVDQWVAGGYGLHDRLKATLPVVKRVKHSFTELAIDWTKPDWK